MKINNSINNYNIKNQYSRLDLEKTLDRASTNLNKIDMTFLEQDVIDYNMLTKLTLENLRQSYKDVNIYIVNTNNNKDIKNFALGLGSGKHLVVSKDFIEKMGSSAEAYNKGKKILEETLKQLSNSESSFKSTGAYIDEKGITFWSTYEKRNPINTNQDNFFDAMKKMQEKLEELKNNFRVINVNSALNEPIDVYSKLARARSIPEVKNVASTARFKINKLKAMLRDCEDEEKSKIKAAIRQLEKAITRSHRKIKDLSEESSLSNEISKAKFTDNKKLDEHKKSELNRRRAIRSVRERAQMNEANPLYYYPQILLNKKNYEPKDEPIPTIDISSLSVGASSYAADVTEQTVVDIMPTIEISI